MSNQEAVARDERGDGKIPASGSPDGDTYRPVVRQRQAKDIIVPLIAFRFINALCVATFFQPDEYFQSLEPAWEIAFGNHSGAWITWEWQYQLRSSLHPAMFAALYFILDKLTNIISLISPFRAIILVVAPKALQALLSATGDYYTWKLAERIYGRGSKSSWAALFLTAMSPWQWFCSTRTLSNSLEMVLTIVALYFWPWALYGDSGYGKRMPAAANLDRQSPKRAPSQSLVFPTAAEVKDFRICLVLAGLACVLRPTNLLIWASLVMISFTGFGLTGPARAKPSDLFIFLGEVILCGTAVLAASATSDRLYFGVWTFPPYQWLNFNITQSLAIFYGTNDWHYYLSQGLPMLLTTYLPFGIVALWSSTAISPTDLSPYIANIRFQLAFVVVTMVSSLSMISHKEVRFIYPLLPSLHILAAPHVASFFTSQPVSSTLLKASTQASVTAKSWRLYVLILLVLSNIGIGLYTTLVHQRGVIDVLSFLRNEYESIHLTKGGLLLPEYDDGIDSNESGYHSRDANETFAAFLMPCHSTPWRSHLVYQTLHAWALTCEPPLHIPANTPERAAYRDEADRFYDDPVGFLKSEVNTRDRPWPRYVVGFEGIESVLIQYYEAERPGWKLQRRWTGFNSHWHDDSRRVGDVVVWQFVDSSRTVQN